jgi:hypothetical protein
VESCPEQQASETHYVVTECIQTLQRLLEASRQAEGQRQEVEHELVRVLQYCLKPGGAEFLEQAASICNSILLDHPEVPAHLHALYPLFLHTITGD